MKLRSFNQKIACILLLGFIFVSAISVGYSQAPLPEGYPKLIDTGNPVEDHRNYDVAKREWIAANPEAYRKMTGEGNTNVLSQKPASENKRTETLVESNPVMIPPYNPEALMLQNNSTEEDLNVSVISKFKDFPVYKDTGNPEEDIQVYNNHKLQWINSNPSEYLKLIGENNALEQGKLNISKSEFEKMPIGKQQNITNNPNLYHIVEDSGTQTVGQMQDTKRIIDDEQQQIIPVIYKVSKEEYENSSPEKINYMKEHPDVYKLPEGYND